MKSLLKTLSAGTAIALLAAQPALAADAAQRLSLSRASAVKSARAGTSVVHANRQIDTIPVWAILLGATALGTGIYFLVRGDGDPDSN